MTEYSYIVIFILFQLCFLIQLYFIVVVQSKLAAYKPAEQAVTVFNPVSVIICARNEEHNLQRYLPSVLEQNYPDFEVIVVNDCSSDSSDETLRKLSQRYPHLKTVTITEHARFKHGKKFAVTLGIKAAKNEILLFTDADCEPVSPNWITKIQRNFRDDTEIVLGYSPYRRVKGLLNAIIRYETFITALNYLSFALAGNPYMGVGRNMAYRKSLFFRNKGFAAHMHIPSGDDDLFVNQNANAGNTTVETDEEAFVYSDAKTSYSAYFKQKIRHQGAGKAYRTEHKRILTLQVLSAVFFYIFLAILIVLKAQWWVLLGIFLIRFISQLVIYGKALKQLHYKDLVYGLLFLDIIYYFYVLTLGIVSVFKKKVQWK